MERKEVYTEKGETHNKLNEMVCQVSILTTENVWRKDNNPTKP